MEMENLFEKPQNKKQQDACFFIALGLGERKRGFLAVCH